MQILKFKSQNSEIIEAKAKQTAELKKKNELLAKTSSKIIPPPEADLLGVWEVVEEWIYSRGSSFPSSVEFEVFHFESLSPGGILTGEVTAQGKNIYEGRTRGGKAPRGLKAFNLEGQILKPGNIRFVMHPNYPFSYFLLNLLSGTHVCEASYNGYEMTGFEHKVSNRNVLYFRALKVE